MSMFKKSKPEAKNQPAAPAPEQPIAVAESPAGEPRPKEAPMPETQTPASAPAAPPAEAGATPGAADAGHAPAGAAATPAAENDPRTLQLMQIFTEEAEGANLNANVYEPFLAPLTMEEVARNARALLDELKALRYG